MQKFAVLIICLFSFLNEYGQSAQEYYERANAKYDKSDYRGAIKDYNKAIKINPEFADAFLERGDCKQALDKNKAAIKDYNKSILFNAKNDVTFTHRGFSKMRLEDYQGAIEDFTKAIEIIPIYWGNYYNRGSAKSHNGEYQEGINDYSKVIELNAPSEDLADTYYEIGKNKLSLGDDEGAYVSLIKARDLGNTEAVELMRENNLLPKDSTLKNYTTQETTHTTPFNINSEHNTIAIKLKALPWLSLIPGGNGINYSAGFEFGFLKNNSIGLDVFLHKYSFDGADVYDSIAKQYVGEPRKRFTDRAIFLNYRHYLNFQKLRESSASSLYVGVFLRYGQLSFKYDKDYVIQSNIVRENHTSIGVMFGILQEIKNFEKSNNSLNLDAYLGLYVKRKELVKEYYDSNQNLKQSSDFPVILGVRLGLTLSFAFKH
jgi:tetratricopeptide (TPR) repeat protein